MEFLELTFSRHGTCKILSDTTLALARSSPTRRYTGRYDNDKGEGDVLGVVNARSR